MNIPDNLLYTKDHEWLKVDGNEGFVGITDFAQHELGDIVFVEVDTVGESIGKEETFGTIEAVKTVSDLFMPVGGEVIEFNTKLESVPETINKDCYGEGWVIKIRIDNPDDLLDLLSAEKYAELVKT